MTRLAATLALALGLAAVASCEHVTGPVAGNVTVTLVTPNNGSDGAILFTLTGPAAVTSVSPGTGLRVFQQGLGSTTHFAVTGPLASGAILTIGVPDVRQVTQYVVTIDEVAGQDYGLRPIAGYGLTVSR